MPTAAQRRQHEAWLLQLTNLPTAAGREDAVVQWITNWTKRRSDLALTADKFGNLILTHTAAPQTDTPLFITAHLDHPAFVATALDADGKTLHADFRGGVHNDYFLHTKVRHAGSGAVGTITDLQPAAPDHPDKRVTILFKKPIIAQPGDVLTWHLPPSSIKDDRLHAPACDDLAAVAAALSTFDLLRKNASPPDVRLLFTRAEEVGFIGALAVARGRSIPRKSRLLCLENSKAFAESPLGAGPIVRVGDRTSVFTPALTDAVARVATRLAAEDESFQWQRKLMPGGTCEATAFNAFGYAATCLCLPLANYHNMAPAPPEVASVSTTKTNARQPLARIAPESIHLDDYHGLIRLLAATASDPDALNLQPKESPLRHRLTALLQSRRNLLDAPANPAP
ncbi:MAG: M20/M25/M40 family metallo-hydrolase [Planctomycetota bacterium]